MPIGESQSTPSSHECIPLSAQRRREGRPGRRSAQHRLGQLLRTLAKGAVLPSRREPVVSLDFEDAFADVLLRVPHRRGPSRPKVDRAHHHVEVLVIPVGVLDHDP